MKNEVSSWKLLLIFLIIVGVLSLFTFKDRIKYYLEENFKKEATDKDFNSKDSTNVVEKIMGTKLLKCKKETTDIETNDKETETITITYRNNKLEVYESEQITESKEDINLGLTFMKAITDAFSQLDGIQMETVKLSDTSYKLYTKIVYNELNAEQLSKLGDESETNKAIVESDMFKKTKININEYRKELEKEYVCEQN